MNDSKAYWLIERRDGPQPRWLLLNGFRVSWVTDATQATAFEDELEAAATRSDFREQLPDGVLLTEHINV